MGKRRTSYAARRLSASKIGMRPDEIGDQRGRASDATRLPFHASAWQSPLREVTRHPWSAVGAVSDRQARSLFIVATARALMRESKRVVPFSRPVVRILTAAKLGCEKFRCLDSEYEHVSQELGAAAADVHISAMGNACVMACGRRKRRDLSQDLLTHTMVDVCSARVSAYPIGHRDAFSLGLRVQQQSDFPHGFTHVSWIIVIIHEALPTGLASRQLGVAQDPRSRR